MLIDARSVLVILTDKFSLKSKLQQVSSSLLNILAVVEISSKEKTPEQSFCKIIWTILKMNKERTQTDGPKNKEINDDPQGLIPKR